MLRRSGWAADGGASMATCSGQRRAARVRNSWSRAGASSGCDSWAGRAAVGRAEDTACGIAGRLAVGVRGGAGLNPAAERGFRSAGRIPVRAIAFHQFITVAGGNDENGWRSGPTFRPGPWGVKLPASMLLLSEVRMATPIPRPDVVTIRRYERAAAEYLRNLPLEHFMEATAQGTQRKITLESFDLITAARSDIHVFNELLVQYP